METPTPLDKRYHAMEQRLSDEAYYAEEYNRQKEEEDIVTNKEKIMNSPEKKESSISEKPQEDIYFYYLRGENRHVFGGVCLKKVDGVWCRGISLCSNKDRMDKNIAKKCARSRLMTAVHTKTDSYSVNPKASDSSEKLHYYYPTFCCKSKYNAELTVMEKRTVGE